MKLKILADSSCDLNADSLDFGEHEFCVVPLAIRVGERDYADDESLDTLALLAAVKASPSGFKTAAPPPEAFEREMETSDAVVCITLSAKLSGTFNSARIAAENVQALHPDKQIFVLDSRLASAGIALILVQLARYLSLHPDCSFQEVTQNLTAWRDEARIRMLLQDMSALAKTGRMGKVTALIASILPVKLICGDNGAGEIKLAAKALGFKRALSVLSQMPLEKAKTAAAFPVVVTHCHNADAALSIATALNESGIQDVVVYPMRGLASLYASDKGVCVAF